MSGLSMCRVVAVGRVGLGGYQPGVYVPLNALFLVTSALTIVKQYAPITTVITA